MNVDQEGAVGAIYGTGCPPGKMTNATLYRQRSYEPFDPSAGARRMIKEEYVLRVTYDGFRATEGVLCGDGVVLAAGQFDDGEEVPYGVFCDWLEDNPHLVSGLTPGEVAGAAALLRGKAYWRSAR